MRRFLDRSRQQKQSLLERSQQFEVIFETSVDCREIKTDCEIPEPQELQLTIPRTNENAVIWRSASEHAGLARVSSLAEQRNPRVIDNDLVLVAMEKLDGLGAYSRREGQQLHTSKRVLDAVAVQFAEAWVLQLAVRSQCLEVDQVADLTWQPKETRRILCLTWCLTWCLIKRVVGGALHTSCFRLCVDGEATGVLKRLGCVVLLTLWRDKAETLILFVEVQQPLTDRLIFIGCGLDFFSFDECRLAKVCKLRRSQTVCAQRIRVEGLLRGGFAVPTTD